MAFATNPQAAIEVETLANALAEIGPDQVLSYAELSGLVGYNVQRVAYWILVQAREKVETETGLRFETIRGVGIRQLPGSDLPGIGMTARKRIGRMTKRVGQRLTGLRYNDIDSATRTRIFAERSLAGAIGAVASTQGNHIAKITKTGPVVPASVFNYVRPERTAETNEGD